MSKRQASEALDEYYGIDSPASKKSRFDDGPELNGNGYGVATPSEKHEGSNVDMESDGDDFEDDKPAKAPIRQSAPTEGYGDLYLDTIDRNVLDFDFEKLCSISLSNINVYACLVCGRYFQGRGPKSHAYFHALEDGHHVFINMETQKVYVLPEGYEVRSKSLDDIKYVSDPRYSREEVMELDRKPRMAWTLGGRQYTPGYVGMNNIKENDYLNVVVQALSHVGPLRNFFLLENFSSRPELVKRCAILFRKIWNPRAFKNHVSPHELLQEISLRSNKKFTLTEQSDPVDFLSWFLNNLHLGLGGSKTKPGSSIIQRIFQGKLKVESQAITAKADVGDRLRFEEAAEVKTDITRFLLLTLDLPPAPLFQDEMEGNIIPQVPLTTILSKYDGVKAQEHLAQRKRYRLMHPLPPYLIFHIKRFSKNKFVSERNPTIVTFDAHVGLDASPYVEPNPANYPPGEPIWYDLVANVTHEAVRAKEDVADTGEERKTWKVQLKDKGRDEWVVCQDLFVEEIQKELLYLGESYLQVWERRREPKGKQKR
ncbi:hypothetical protein FHL15_003643 [Xylaria flabelliformis]|uniref:USP domain-containing protein n=1 Tax=Xylaria flabelliformis TaxID=2512241 RepID=A0A553I536_9PEZI|nr:hypothetical protein FHL15_003643 [Xylaria flabelliformis]